MPHVLSATQLVVFVIPYLLGVKNPPLIQRKHLKKTTPSSPHVFLFGGGGEHKPLTKTPFSLPSSSRFVSPPFLSQEVGGLRGAGGPRERGRPAGGGPGLPAGGGLAPGVAGGRGGGPRGLPEAGRRGVK